MSHLEESPRRPRLVRLLLTVSLVVSLSDAAHAADRPSRPPVKGCAWTKASNAAIGLEAWVQRCDFGFRKIDFQFQGVSLAVRYSDGGGAPDPLVDVLDLKSGESHAAGIRDGKPPAGVELYTFEPNAAYQKDLDRTRDPNEGPDPPCGDWGTAPDGIQYFEAHPASAARKVLFVRVGQDEPLFDEQTLRLLPMR